MQAPLERIGHAPPLERQNPPPVADVLKKAIGLGIPVTGKSPPGQSAEHQAIRQRLRCHPNERHRGERHHLIDRPEQDLLRRIEIARKFKGFAHGETARTGGNAQLRRTGRYVAGEIGPFLGGICWNANARTQTGSKMRGSMSVTALQRELSVFQRALLEKLPEQERSGAESRAAIIAALLKLAPLVFARPSDLRRARWANIDLEKAEWRFTADKTGKPHIVLLAAQVVDILRGLHPLTIGPG